MSQYEWFPRLASIPGVGYAGRSDVDRRGLPGYGAKPQIETFRLGEETHVSASWRLADGVMTSQSPASAWGFAEAETPSDVVQRAYEALELPGQASEYHFILMHAYRKLWALRRGQPDVLAEFERLCLLDLRLVEARPDIIDCGDGSKASALAVPAYGYLIFLYEAEGFFRDALDIARRGAAHGQGTDDVKRLEARLDAEP